MGQNFGCNCMDRKDDSKKKGNTLARPHFQREFQIDGSYDTDKSLVWFMNQQRGMQKQQATYVLKHPVIDMNSSFLTDSSKSFMINGERVNAHKDSHCSFSEETNDLSIDNANKFKIVQVPNSEVLNFLKKSKDPSLIPTYISPHPQDKDDSLIALQASVRRNMIATSPFQKAQTNLDYSIKSFSISTDSLSAAYQQIYSYFKKDAQENYSYLGYNFSEKELGQIELNLFFQVKPLSHFSNSNLSTNRSNSSTQSSQNLFDFETIEKLEQTNIETIINGNLREGKVFRGCISLLNSKDQTDGNKLIIKIILCEKELNYSDDEDK